MRFSTLLPRCLAAVCAVLTATSCTPPREAPGRLVIWHQKTGAERAFFEEAVAGYNRSHPGERVVALYRENEELRNSFIIAAVAGQGPDLIFGPSDNVALFAGARVIRPWEEVLETGFLAQFTDDGLVAWQDRTWLVADQIGNQLMLVYDRTVVSEPPGTLDELVELGSKLTQRTEGRTDRYALTWNYAEPYFFIPFLTGFGGWIMDDEGNPTLDTPEMRAALQFVLDLRDRHGIVPRYADYDTSNLMFLRRRAAMIINGPWSWSDYGVPEQSMLALLPVNSATGLRCRPIIAAKGYSLSVNTPPEKFDLVRRVLAFFTSEDIQLSMAQRLFTTPTLRRALQSPVFRSNAVLQLALEQSKNAIPMPIDPRLRYIWDGIRGPYRRVFTGDLTPAEAARLMQREAEDRIMEGMP
ncbi:MAG: extracellular solute-binding protein [Chthoniobacterales bacterium]